MLDPVSHSVNAAVVSATETAVLEYTEFDGPSFELAHMKDFADTGIHNLHWLCAGGLGSSDAGDDIHDNLLYENYPCQIMHSAVNLALTLVAAVSGPMLSAGGALLALEVSDLKVRHVQVCIFSVERFSLFLHMG